MFSIPNPFNHNINCSKVISLIKALDLVIDYLIYQSRLTERGFAEVEPSAKPKMHISPWQPNHPSPNSIRSSQPTLLRNKITNNPLKVPLPRWPNPPGRPLEVREASTKLPQLRRLCEGETTLRKNMRLIVKHQRHRDRLMRGHHRGHQSIGHHQGHRVIGHHQEYSSGMAAGHLSGQQEAVVVWSSSIRQGWIQRWWRERLPDRCG